MNQFNFRQSGAVLFICLMFMTIMTILGINAVSTTTLEEKMAGNVRNKHMSFQAAEAALRAGETASNALTTETLFNTVDGLYPQSKYGDSTYPIWEEDSGVNWETVNTLGSLVSEDPSYIIENFGTSPRDNDCILDAEVPAGCLLPVYRITAQGWGLNTNGFSMLQSTYKQL